MTILKFRIESNKIFNESNYFVKQRGSIRVSSNPVNAANVWTPTPEWVASWRAKLPLQTIMRLLQVLVPQVEKICIDKYVRNDQAQIMCVFINFDLFRFEQRFDG